MKGCKNSSALRRVKFLFWVVLGTLPVFFAEVVSGSEHVSFIPHLGFVVVFPLYTPHILVLSHVAFSRGVPGFYTLFIAGTVFGMYEAYITKVLWNPWWGSLISVAGVGVMEVIVLVFFWHPFMSFTIPILVGESMMIGSGISWKMLPERIRRLIKSRRRRYMSFAALFMLLGIVQSVTSPLSRSFSGFNFFTCSHTDPACQGMGEVEWERARYLFPLPSREEFFVLLAVLAGMYVFLGTTLRPEALPGLLPQVIIWMIYLSLFSLLALNL